MTTNANDAQRLYLMDEQGEYFVLTPTMKEPAKIPSEHKAEVDEVLGEVSGYAMTPQLSAFPNFTAVSQPNFSIRVACFGSCGRTFGVPALTQQFRS
jgi:hypothetical protein